MLTPPLYITRSFPDLTLQLDELVWSKNDTNDVSLLLDMIDGILIEVVKSKPELYDMSTPLYNNIHARRRSWIEVNKQVGCEGKHNLQVYMNVKNF